MYRHYCKSCNNFYDGSAVLAELYTIVDRKLTYVSNPVKPLTLHFVHRVFSSSAILMNLHNIITLTRDLVLPPECCHKMLL